MNKEQFDIGMRRMERALYQDGSGGNQALEKFAELEVLRKSIDIQLAGEDSRAQEPVDASPAGLHLFRVHARDGRDYMIDPANVTFRVVRVDGDQMTLDVEVLPRRRSVTITVPGEGGIDG